MAFAHARVRDSHKVRPGTQVRDVTAARVPHRRAQAAGELLDDLHDAALVGHATFDTFRHELLELARAVLEIAVGGAVALGHRTERAHAAIALVARTLIQLDLAG